MLKNEYFRIMLKYVFLRVVLTTWILYLQTTSEAFSGHKLRTNDLELSIYPYDK